MAHREAGENPNRQVLLGSLLRLLAITCAERSPQNPERMGSESLGYSALNLWDLILSLCGWCHNQIGLGDTQLMPAAELDACLLRGKTLTAFEVTEVFCVDCGVTLEENRHFVFPRDKWFHKAALRKHSPAFPRFWGKLYCDPVFL